MVERRTLIDYFSGDELASSVWKGKYAANGETTPYDMHKRMAKEFARIERNYQEGEIKTSNLSEYGKSRGHLDEEIIFKMFDHFGHIVPQGRVMAGLGVKESYRSLSNCLRLPPPKDSYSSIMYVDTMLVSAAKRGCGYGLGISNLRNDGASVSNSAGSSTGAVSFMPRYSNSTREVAQKGRRGACLIDIEVRHPDSPDFVNSKKDRSQITGANISVKALDEFFEAVEKDEDYFLRFPTSFDLEPYKGWAHFNDMPYNVTEEHCFDKEMVAIKKIKAREYFDNVVENAWENAEPGLFFWSRMLDYDPSNVYEKYRVDGTNACGEQPMAVGDTCRLICLNLLTYITNAFTTKAELNVDLLYRMSYEMMRLGDDLVDLEIEYVDRILNKIKSDDLPEREKAIEIELWELVKDMAESGRRVGCGITGLGDMIAAMGYKYDSKEALELIDQVMYIKMQAELDCTIDLAILRGTFTSWDPNLEYSKNELEGSSTWHGNGNNEFYQFLYEEFPEQALRMQIFGRRNVNWSTIAPTGTVSLMTQTTSGCEPLFKAYYIRRRKVNPDDKEVRVDFTDQNGDKWMEYPVLHPQFKKWLEYRVDNPEGLSKEELGVMFKESPWYGSEADDIDWKKRVEIQSILQKYTSSAISSTINLPNNVTKEEVAEIYMHAWKMGLKGVTVYRDGCRTGVLVNETTVIEEFKQHDAAKRPERLSGDLYSIRYRGEDWLVSVGLLSEKPYEIFATRDEWAIPKNSKCTIIKKSKGRYDLEFTESDTLRTISDFTEPMENEEAISTRLISLALRHGTDIKYIVEQVSKTHGDLSSFSKVVSRVLKKYIPEGAKSTITCQECGSEEVHFTEGCLSCKNCGSSKCG